MTDVIIDTCRIAVSFRMPILYTGKEIGRIYNSDIKYLRIVGYKN